MLAAKVALYFSATKAVTWAGSLGFAAFLALLGFLYAGAVQGVPPPNVTMLALSARGLASGVVGGLVRPESRPQIGAAAPSKKT